MNTTENRILLWARDGTLACVRHAPVPGSDLWHSEGWRRVPDATLVALASSGRKAIACEACVAERRARAEAGR